MRLALLALFAGSPVVLATASQAQVGSMQVVIAKAGLIAGAGAGRGVLTFRGRDYPFSVAGLSLGLTVGATVNKFVGRVSYLNHLNDFPGTYSAVGGGGALVGGAGAVQLKNEKGVIITLRGLRAGLELSANRSGVTIAFR
jgi:hypothetical protein